MKQYQEILDSFDSYLTDILNSHPTGMLTGGTEDGLMQKYKALKLFIEDMQNRGGMFLSELLSDVPEQDKDEVHAALKKIGEEKVSDFLSNNNF